ncbi:MAG: site-specific integrase [Gammaproteobacteria bacterium]|nr:site-specific integrase [Gammaproteobacteria bacterium]
MLIGMPKLIRPLTAVEINHISTPGWHAVGGVAGLLLQVGHSIADRPTPKCWLLRRMVGGKRQLMGLGPYPEVSLAQAREAAKKFSDAIRQGRNPAEERRAKKSALSAAKARQKTFRQCAADYLSRHREDHTNAKHAAQWETTLETYAYPRLGNMLVSDITMRDVLDVLEQPTSGKAAPNGDRRFWYAKTETAKRLLGRIKSILDFATVNDYRTGSNPAIWTGLLSTQLPAPDKVQPTVHHPAVPYQEIGLFLANLRQVEGMAARALEFLVLTAVRSGSVRSAEWQEIDLEAALWTIPAEHTKTKQVHRVPLCPAVVQMLKALPRLARGDLIFPNMRSGKALSDAALGKVMRDMQIKGLLKIDAVPHGFRSTFRDWGAEVTNYPDEVRKAASGHQVGDAVQQAYQRGDLLDKRRRMMADWGAFCGRLPVPSTVTAMRRKK